jgi:DNA-directed RNA polymerase subunit RPC12/RpoP
MGRRIKCLVCEKWIKLFGTDRIANHAATHDDLLLLVCRVCGLTFRDIEIYKEHRLTHDDKNDFILEIPLGTSHYKTIKSSDEVDRDLKYPCTDCGKEFTTEKYLKQHKVVHDEIGKFKCNECGKDFKRKQEITLHLQSHSNERNFECSTCGKAFKTKNNLSQHKKHRKFCEGRKI